MQTQRYSTKGACSPRKAEETKGGASSRQGVWESFVWEGSFELGLAGRIRVLPSRKRREDIHFRPKDQLGQSTGRVRVWGKLERAETKEDMGGDVTERDPCGVG